MNNEEKYNTTDRLTLLVYIYMGILLVILNDSDILRFNNFFFNKNTLTRYKKNSVAY